jgi:beta-glucosidase
VDGEESTPPPVRKLSQRPFSPDAVCPTFQEPRTMKFSRRTFARLASGSAAALTLSTAEVEAKAAASPAPALLRGFPEGFLWGSATASYQVEGAVHEGGRGVSIWDTFSHTPGKVANGDTGDVADDYYHRYREDIALMKQLGLKTCRFSVAWTRIFPNGSGAPNPEGIAFYERMVDAMLEAGVEPYCTLYHWDLPQALQDKGGWENPDTPRLFAADAGYVAGKLYPKVKHYMTVNELRIFTGQGYGDGSHAPGLRVGEKRLAQLSHYAVLGHGMAVRAIRAHAPGAQIGLADNAVAITPAVETPEHIAAAHKAFREENARFLTAILDGRYTEGYLQRLGANAPHFTAEEMAIIATPLDFVGINVYEPVYVLAADNAKGYTMVPVPASYPHMYSNWLRIGPEALYWVPKLVTDLWRPKAIYITENGASSKDAVAGDGQVYDTDRVMFLRNYLTQLQRATADGVPLKGYFLWSLLDNFEWADGYDKRFGIVYVDFATQQRIPKLSAEFYRETIRKNAVS